MPEHVVTLEVAGARYSGWQRVSVTRSLEQLTGSFDLTLTDKWSLDGGRLQLLDGQACRVLIDGAPVITGFIDEAAPQYDERSHSVSLSGRDRTGDLVDCAALHASQEINGRTLLQVAHDLCAPFGISVSADTDIGPALPTTHIQPGETVYEILDRLARLRGVLYTADGQGHLKLTRAGNEKAAAKLELGVNIKAGRGQRSRRDRYSQYQVLGQQRASDQLDAATAAQAHSRVTDPGVTRYRPTVIEAEDQASTADCRTRGEWERSVRAGRGNQATVTVIGWTDGVALWQPNRLVETNDRWLGLAGVYLITAVTYNADDSGQTADLTLMPPDAFAVLEATRRDPAAGGLYAQGAA